MILATQATFMALISGLWNAEASHRRPKPT
jgi:hypothetical protein